MNTSDMISTRTLTLSELISGSNEERLSVYSEWSDSRFIGVNGEIEITFDTGRTTNMLDSQIYHESYQNDAFVVNHSVFVSHFVPEKHSLLASVGENCL